MFVVLVWSPRYIEYILRMCHGHTGIQGFMADRCAPSTSWHSDPAVTKSSPRSMRICTFWTICSQTRPSLEKQTSHSVWHASSLTRQSQLHPQFPPHTQSMLCRQPGVPVSVQRQHCFLLLLFFPLIFLRSQQTHDRKNGSENQRSEVWVSHAQSRHIDT